MSNTHIPLDLPNAAGHFGIHGGRFVSETLTAALDELTVTYLKLREDPEFLKAFDYDLAHYVGRPSPLYFAERLTQHCGGAQIWLKREDLNHTGAHKINNTIGQALLAKFMGKKKVIAETGAGQHGVATATVAARFGLQCKVFMGAVDVERQKLNVFRMKLLGAEVESVSSGTQTLKDAMNEAMRHWVTHVDDTFYIIGTAAGPHPYPMLVRDFQSVIGRELKRQCPEQIGRQPDALVACVGGGSNAIGMFHPYLADTDVALHGVEAAGKGLETGLHAAPINCGRPGVLHGNRSYLMADDNGQILGTHSISAGLDYPGVGPEHSWLHDIGRATYGSCTDEQAIDAFHKLTELEGIMPALESAHAIGYGMQLAASMTADKVIVINVSGRGDKDIHTIAALEGVTA